MRIELYPTTKSCPMKCAGCNLSSNSNSPIETNLMDPCVKETFSFLQDIIAKNNLSSVLWCSLPDNASVEKDLNNIINTSLFRHIGVAVGQMGSSSNYVSSTVTKIQKLFSEKDFTHTTLKCIITRPNPSIGWVEKIQDLYSALYDVFNPIWTQWIHVWLEYNMENYDFFLKQIPIVSQQNWQHYAYLKSKYSDAKVSSSLSIEDAGPVAVLRARSFAHLKWHNYGITSRYIARVYQDTLDTYHQRALLMIDDNSPFEESLSLYPHAILLHHSSIDLNNHFFWVSYDDFYKTMNKKNDFHSWFKAIIANNISNYASNNKTFTKEHMALVNPK